jgi:hypothetical protein
MLNVFVGTLIGLCIASSVGIDAIDQPLLVPITCGSAAIVYLRHLARCRARVTSILLQRAPSPFRDIAHATGIRSPTLWLVLYIMHVRREVVRTRAGGESSKRPRWGVTNRVRRRTLVKLREQGTPNRFGRLRLPRFATIHTIIGIT